MSSDPIDRIILDSELRTQKRKRLQEIQDGVMARIQRVLVAVNGLADEIGRYGCRPPAAHPDLADRQTALANAFLELCRAVRAERFDRGIDLIMEQDSDDCLDTRRLSIGIFGLAAQGDLPGILDLLQRIALLPFTSDHFNPDAASQSGVWSAARELLPILIPARECGAERSWLPEHKEVSQLQTELGRAEPGQHGGTEGPEVTNLQATIETCAQRIREDPRILWAFEWEHPDKLNIGRINEVAGRQVFAVLEHGRRLQINHPQPYHPPITFPSGSGADATEEIRQAMDTTYRPNRVDIAIAYLQAWVIASATQPSTTTAQGEGKRRAKGEQVPKRSWTQVELDATIREYKARRASNYNDLVKAIKEGRSGATKDAQKMFGRNTIASALGVRSHAMVTKSEAWQQIADELKLRGKRIGRRLDKTKRIGHDIAIERQAEEGGDPTEAMVIQNETIRLAKEKLPLKEADAVIDKLVRGEITDSQARKIIDCAAESVSDAKRKRVNSSP